MEQQITGLTVGNFDAVNFMRNSLYQDLNDVLDGIGGGGGGGSVTTVNAPLSLSNGVLSISLSNYTTVSAVNALIAAAAYNHPASHPISMITNLQTELDSKQGNLTASSGVSLNGNNLTGYGLRWLINSIPSITIQDLHFKAGFVVSETLNVGNGRNQLDISVDLSNYLTSAQISTALALKQNIVTAGNGIALNGSTIVADTNVLATRAFVISDYTTTTALNTALALKSDLSFVSTGFANVATDLLSKQNTLTAGSNITISGNTIAAAGGSSLGLQLAGVSQTATNLNFVDLNGSLASGTLSISLPSSYASLSLVNGSTIKDLVQDANGNLVYSNDIVTTNPYMVNVLQAYPTTAVMNNTLSSYALTTAMNTALAAKQATLTTGPGAFLTGSALSGYGLRWLTNGSPSTAIHDLHFKSGFTIAETFDLGTGRTALDITSAPDLSAYSTTAQTATLLAAKQVNLSATQTSSETVFDRDVILTQAGNNPALKWRVPGYPDMRFLLQSNGNAGLNCSGQYFSITTGGASYHMPILCNNQDVTVAGTLTASVKNFTIRDPRPDVTPSAQNMTPKLRHWCVEGDTPAGLLMYRRQVTASSAGNYTIQMPDWFEYLAGEVQCFSSPAGRHFGLSWAERDANDPNLIQVGCSKAGSYNVLITAARMDHCALHMCEREVLFEEEVRENNLDSQ